jgi:hypothetical protein
VEPSALAYFLFTYQPNLIICEQILIRIVRVLSVILKKKTVKIDFFFLEEFCSLPDRIKSDIDSVGYIQHDVVFQCLPIVLQRKEILDSFETTRV